MKLMQVIGAAKPGGAETFYVRFIRAMVKRHNVLPVVKKGSWIHERLAEEDIEHVELPFGGALDFSTKRKMKKLIKEFQPDVIQGWMSRACKFIPQTDVATSGRMGGHYPLKYYKTCDYFFGNTLDVSAYLKDSGVSEERVSYLPNFTDFPDENYRDQGTATREKYGIPQDVKVLLAAGRLHANKAFDVAIKALSKLDENVHLVLAGNDSGEGDALKTLVAELDLEGRVHFIGWVSDITEVAAMTDVWLVPSRWEPLGNTVLDAWVHKIPCVAAKSAGPVSLIEDGENGLLTELEDDKQMAEAVKSVLVDEKAAKGMAEKGYQYVKENFSEEVVVAQFEAYYKEISSKK